MAKTITIEMTETEAQKLESLIDKTLAALRKIEEESPQRDARLEQKLARTSKIMDEIESRLKEIAELNANGKRFTADLSLD